MQLVRLASDAVQLLVGLIVARVSCSGHHALCGAGASPLASYSTLSPHTTIDRSLALYDGIGETGQLRKGSSSRQTRNPNRRPTTRKSLRTGSTSSWLSSRRNPTSARMRGRPREKRPWRPRQRFSPTMALTQRREQWRRRWVYPWALPSRLGCSASKAGKAYGHRTCQPRKTGSGPCHQTDPWLVLTPHNGTPIRQASRVETTGSYCVSSGVPNGGDVL